MYETDEEGNYTDVIIWTPPSLYPWILVEDWKKFVEISTDPKFKELSELNRERAKKRKTSYSGGRKGYSYYEDEIAKELQTQGIEVVDVPRHLVWIRAHSREEDGVLKFDNPANFEIAQAIKALEAQHNQGEIDASGRNDILARALNTPEHGGCVRAVGGGVTNKEYFGYKKPTPPYQLHSDLKQVRTKLETVTNNQNFLMSFIMSNFQMTPEQFHQFQLGSARAQFRGFGVNQDVYGTTFTELLSSSGLDMSGDRQVPTEFGKHQSSCDFTIDRLGSTQGKSMTTHGLQGFHIQLASRPQHHQQDDVLTQTCHDVSKSQHHLQLDVPTETYHVSWPKPTEPHTDHANGYVPENSFNSYNQATDIDHGNGYVPENSFNSSLHKQAITNNAFPEGVDSDCSLAIEQNNGVQVVAIGKVYIGKGSEVVKHHFKPVPGDCYRVCIKEGIDTTSSLPFPEGGITSVCEGINHFLLWPTHLVFSVNKVDKQMVKEIITPSTHTLSSSTKYVITPEEKLKLTTNLVRVCKTLALDLKNKNKTIPINIPHSVFYNEQDITIDYEDMRDWCFQRNIGTSHMSTFMMHLSEMVHAQGISGVYGFCDSNFISPETPTQENENDRCDYLVRVFARNNAQNRNQILFATYSDNLHWMLAVICPWVGLVHWLDPAGVECQPRQFARDIINKAILKFNLKFRAEIKWKKNSPVKWKQVECPRQGLDFDCGYYVCRYMLETIQSRKSYVPDKVLFFQLLYSILYCIQS